MNCDHALAFCREKKRPRRQTPKRGKWERGERGGRGGRGRRGRRGGRGGSSGAAGRRRRKNRDHKHIFLELLHALVLRRESTKAETETEADIEPETETETEAEAEAEAGTKIGCFVRVVSELGSEFVPNTNSECRKYDSKPKFREDQALMQGFGIGGG